MMGFASTTTYPVGAIILLIYLGEGWKTLTINITFIVVDASASYNTILGRSTLNPHWMVHSTYHQMMKFLSPHGIGVEKGKQPVVHNCYVHSLHCHILMKGNETISI